jgi:hypothetical protein
MLSLIKKLFGATPAETPAPYKVETPKVETPKAVEKPAPKAKKPAVKKATTRKPKAPKA